MMNKIVGDILTQIQLLVTFILLIMNKIFIGDIIGNILAGALASGMVFGSILKGGNTLTLG